MMNLSNDLSLFRAQALALARLHVPEFSPDLIPPLGAIAFSDSARPLAVAFLYLEQSTPVACLSFVFADPENTLSESASSVSAVIRSCVDLARSRGKSFLLAFTANAGINRILDTLGFLSGDSGVTHKIKVLS